MKCYGFRVVVWLDGEVFLAQSPEMPTRRYTGDLVTTLTIDAFPGACWIEDATIEPRFLYVDEAKAIRTIPLPTLIEDGVLEVNNIDCCCAECRGCEP